MAEVIADLEAVVGGAGSTPPSVTLEEAATEARMDFSYLARPAVIRAVSPSGPRTWLKPPKLWFLVGGGLLGLVGLLAVVLSLRASEGTVIIEVGDPEATIKVLDDGGKTMVERKGENGTFTLSLPPGHGKIRLEKNGGEIFAQEFALPAGGKEYIKAK